MKLTDTNRFYLKGTNDKWLHLATVHHGLREYMCFSNTETQQVYIEEVTGGHLEFIEDNSLAQELANFLTFHEVLHMGKPMLTDNEWLRKNKNT